MKIQPFMMISVVLATVLTGVNAWAQWHWLDDQGRKVFSDRPPGPEIPEKNIIKRPSLAATPANTRATTPSAATETPLPTGGGTTPKPPVSPAASGPKSDKTDKLTTDQALKQKQEQDRIAAAKAQNCASAQRQMAGLKAGGRIARFNEKGEREFLDDAAKATEIRQTQKMIDADCK